MVFQKKKYRKFQPKKRSLSQLRGKPAEIPEEYKDLAVNTVAAPKGNRFWEARSTHGRKPTFEYPDQLWDACCQYFQWVEDNPLWEYKLVSYQGESQLENVPKMRAMTIGGLCIYLDISIDTWHSYRKKNKEFSEVCSAAENVVYNQKFAGASADLLNASIIARDLGLADRKEVNNPDGNLGSRAVVVMPCLPEQLTMDQWKKFYDSMDRSDPEALDVDFESIEPGSESSGPGES